jgi:hypothetical protein
MSSRKPDQPEFFERLVVMTAQHGEKFFGWVAHPTEDPEQYIESRIAEKKPVLLEDARLLVSQLQVMNDSRGNPVLNNMMLLMPLDSFVSGVENLWVYPSSWYFPKNNEKCQGKIKDLFRACLEMELAKAAAEMNLVIPGLKANLPPPGRMQ